MEARSCPFCNAELPADPELRFCSQCGATLPAPGAAPEPSAVSGDPLEGDIPMEHVSSYGFFGALWETFRQAALEPASFFRRVGRSTDLNAALLFLIIVGSASGIIQTLWNAVFQGAMMSFLPFATGEGAEMMAFMGASMVGRVLIGIVAAPIVSLIGWGIGTLVVHLCLMITGGARKDLATTGRVVAYAAAPQLLVVVPFLGALVAGIWAIVIEIIGLSRAHETDTWRAVVAVFLPLVVCCCLMIGLYTAVLVPLIAGAARQGGF